MPGPAALHGQTSIECNRARERSKAGTVNTEHVVIGPEIVPSYDQSAVSKLLDDRVPLSANWGSVGDVNCFWNCGVAGSLCISWDETIISIWFAGGKK